jgi:hypothetical protein
MKPPEDSWKRQGNHQNHPPDKFKRWVASIVRPRATDRPRVSAGCYIENRLVFRGAHHTIQTSWSPRAAVGLRRTADQEHRHVRKEAPNKDLINYRAGQDKGQQHTTSGAGRRQSDTFRSVSHLVSMGRWRSTHRNARGLEWGADHQRSAIGRPRRTLRRGRVGLSTPVVL